MMNKNSNTNNITSTNSNDNIDIGINSNDSTGINTNASTSTDINTNASTPFVRNDEVTKAFLDLREGKATSEQELIIFNACKRKVDILASNYLTAIDRDDFLGDVYLKIMEKKESYDPEQSSFETWLSWQCLAVRKRMYESYSSKMKKNAYSLDALSDVYDEGFCREIEDIRNVSAERKIVFDECMKVVNELIGELSENKRNVIEAIYMKNMKPMEAAATLNRNRERLYRDHNCALNSLKNKLKRRDYNYDDVKEIL